MAALETKQRKRVMVSSFWISLGSWITGTREVMITSECAAVLDRGKLAERRKVAPVDANRQ